MEQLLNSLRKHSLIYLNEIGSFYPFGSLIDLQNKNQPLTILPNEDEIDNPNSYIKLLSKYLIDEIESGNINAGGFAINQEFKGSDIKIDAIEFRIFDNLGNFEIKYLPYYFDSKELYYSNKYYSEPWKFTFSNVSKF